MKNIDIISFNNLYIIIMDPFDNNQEETKEELFTNEVTIWIETHGKKKNI